MSIEQRQPISGGRVGEGSNPQYEYGNSKDYEKERRLLGVILKIGPEKFQQKRVEFTHNVISLIRELVGSNTMFRREIEEKFGGEIAAQIINPAFDIVQKYDGSLSARKQMDPIDIEDGGITIYSDHGRDLAEQKPPAEIQMMEHGFSQSQYWYLKIPQGVWSRISGQFTPEEREFVEVLRLKHELERDIGEYKFLKERFANIGIDLENPALFPLE